MGHRGRVLTLAIAALVWGLVVPSHAAPLEVFYVSPAGNDAWSGRLAEPNAARSDGPLASLVGARDAIRKRKAAGALAAPVEVRLRGGVYRPQEMLVLESQDSGSAQCPISYMACAGEKPVISGGVPIAGFGPWRGKIVCADLPASLAPGAYFRSLFVDGRRMIRARYPNYVPTESYDTGGLEVTQHSRNHHTGSIFRYNLIHDTGGYSSMMGREMYNSWGIYLDSFAGGFTVYGNVVYGTSDGGLMVQGGKNNKVYNNIFAENGLRRQLLIANFADNSRGTEFHHNIVAYAAADAVAIYCNREVVHSVKRVFSGERTMRMCLAALAAWSLCGNLFAAEAGYDLVVYGGTSGGVTAAVQAAAMGKTAVVIESGRHLGGLTSGGLGATDSGCSSMPRTKAT